MIPTGKSLKLRYGNKDAAANSFGGDLLIRDEIVDGTLTDGES